MTKKIGKNVLFIYSCLQDRTFLEHNIVEIYKSVEAISEDVNIYFFSSTETMKLALPDRVHFFVEKITEKKIKKIVKKFKINCVYPTIGDCDEIIRGLNDFFKKNKVENVYSDYYTNKQNTKNLIPFAKKVGFSTKRKSLKFFEKNKREHFLNFICIKDNFEQQLVLDIFESFYDDKNCLFCSETGFYDVDELLKIRAIVDNFGEFIQCKKTFYCIKVSVESGKIFFNDIKFGNCDEVLFFLEKKIINHKNLIRNIHERFYIFPKMNRETFYYSKDNGKNGICFIRKSSNCFFEKVVSFLNKKSICSVERLLFFLKKNNETLQSFSYKNEVVFIRKYEAFGFGENLLIVDFREKDSDINDRLLFFRICQELNKVKNCRLVYISDQFSCLVGLLPECDIITIADNGSLEEELKVVIKSYSISDVFLNPIRENENCFNKLCRVKSIRFLGLNRDFKFLHNEALIDLSNECNLTFQGERLDQEQKILHFLCFKDRYNNAIFHKVVGEEFVSSNNLHCFFSPIVGCDYSCEKAIESYAFAILEKIKCFGIIDIEFIYNDGDISLKNVAINSSKILFFEDKRYNYFIHLATTSLLGENIFALKKGKLDVRKKFVQTILVIHGDGQVVVVSNRAKKGAFDDYYGRIVQQNPKKKPALHWGVLQN